MKIALKYAEANPLIAGGLVLGLIAAAWYVKRGAQGMGADIGGAAVQMFDGVASGAVKGIGGLFGIPDTDAERGNAAVQNGDWLGASAYLPAPSFIAAASQNAATSIVAAANDPNKNPLQPFGSWMGTTIYNLTH